MKRCQIPRSMMGTRTEMIQNYNGEERWKGKMFVADFFLFNPYHNPLRVEMKKLRLRGSKVSFRYQISHSFNSSAHCLSQGNSMDACQVDLLCLGFNTLFGSSAPVSGFIERTPYWKGQQQLNHFRLTLQYGLVDGQLGSRFGGHGPLLRVQWKEIRKQEMIPKTTLNFLILMRACSVSLALFLFGYGWKKEDK